jgi:hypothetical protein
MKMMLLLMLLSHNSFAQNEESEYFRALRLSCEKQKVALGCFNYANTLMRAGNEDLANKYFDLGCKQNHTPSCSKEKWDTPINKLAVDTPPESAPEQAPDSVPEPPPESAPEQVPDSATGPVDLNLDVGNTINE